MNAVNRKTFAIHGGIHPPENKTQSNERPIEKAGIPPLLVLPLSQHIGAPATPIVAIGETVLKGQMIAAANGMISAPVHASSSGTVVAIEDRPLPHASGMHGPCIVIETDGRDEWVKRHGISDFHAVDAGHLTQIIRDAGIAGMGGAGFPTAVKLSPRPGADVDTLIINGTECEPYITADDVLMRERATEIIRGIQILQHIIKPTSETLVGIEDNKPEAIEAMRRAAANTGIEIVAFHTKYPSGGEKQLVEILTGRQVPSGGLPADIGIVCQNIGTAVAVYHAIALGEPLISRITTVTGFACKKQSNFDVLLGTPASYLLDKNGFDKAHCQRLVMGGPMMGFTLHSTDAPVVKTTNCLLAATADELAPPPPAQACIRCGMCSEACPASLLPQQLYWFARGKESEKLQDHNLFDCIECGACSYVCPSNIPLVQYYRAAKADIRQQQIDHQKAEQSKARYEARQARIEQLEEEKAAKRAARLAAAQAKASSSTEAGTGEKSSDSKADIIKAAIERAKAKKASADAGTATGEKASGENTEEKAAVDPAAAAIERAQAKRAGIVDGTPPDRATLEAAVATAETRLASAAEKLDEAKAQNSDKVAAFETAVSKMQSKLTQVQNALADFTATESAQPAASDDPAQAAIARAMAKRNSQGTMSAEEKRAQQIESLQSRISKAKEKLATAETAGADTVTVLRDSLAKLEDKHTQLIADNTEQE